jgi:hypothetical protein
MAQSDGYELTSVPVNTDDETGNTNMTEIGTTPHEIMTYLLTARSSEVLNKISTGKWGETSAYGIEHFGNLYIRANDNIEFSDTYFDDDAKTPSEYWSNAARKAAKAQKNGLASLYTGLRYGSAVGEEIAWAGWGLMRTISATVLPDEFFRQEWYEDYDIAKNIYNGNYVIKNIFEGADANTEEMWFNKGVAKNSDSGDKSNEPTVSLWTYNKTLWDTFQVLAGIMPDFICQPHYHQFRSTLFYGMPMWDVKYKYEYVSKDEIYEYSKPFSQLHILNSTFDIIDNAIKAVAPENSAIVGVYSDSKGNKKSIPTVYADRSIKSEFVRMATIESGLKWTFTGSSWFDGAVDKFYISNILDFMGVTDIKNGGCRNLAIAALQDSFRDMYQGSLLIMGDASIKPYDTLYISDSYVGMEGHGEVGAVVHHMGIDTGFVTDIKVDLCTESVNADLMKYRAIEAISGLGIAAAMYFGKFGAYAKAKLLANTVKTSATIAKFGDSLLATNSVIASAAKSKEGGLLYRTVYKGYEVVLRAETGIVKVKGIITAAKASRSATFLAGAATGEGIIAAIAWILIVQIIDVMTRNTIR